ncbi:MAG: hypothetical protein RLZZ535_3032, partial [Cyanobacteriota bacterium]
KAISSGNSLARTLILFLFVLGLLYLIATNLVDRILGDGGEISYAPNGNFIISNKRKEKIQVLNVPAYQSFTSTGIEFNKVNKLTIGATGLVSTGLYVPGFMKKQFSDKSDNLSKINERLSKIEFNDNSYLGWREANGNLIQKFKSDESSINGEKCISDKSKEKRILKEEEYGVLLGFFADSDSKAKQMLRKDNNENGFFAVGKKAEIALSSSSKVIVTTFDRDEKNQSKSFELDKVRGFLYFTVNDSIIRKGTDFEMFSGCADKKDKDQGEKKVKIYKELYDNIDDMQGDKAAIWFMDNRGNFTVNIITTLQ